MGDRLLIGRRKKEEGRRKKEEGRGKKALVIVATEGRRHTQQAF